MDFIESFKGFLRSNFNAIEDVVNSVSSAVAEQYVDKLISNENLFINLGLPFIVEESSISNIKIQQKSCNISSQYDTIYVDLVEFKIAPYEEESTAMYNKIPPLEAYLNIKEMRITIDIPEFENTFTLICKDMTVNLSSTNGNSIQCSSFTFVDKTSTIFSIPNFSMKITKNMAIELDLDTLSISLSALNLRMFNRLLGIKATHKIALHFNCINISVGASTFIKFENVSIIRIDVISFDVKKLTFNISSMRITITDLNYTHEKFSIGDISTGNTSLFIEKLSEDKLITILFKEDTNVLTIANLKIHLDSKRLSAIFRNLYTNSFFIAFFRRFVGANFEMQKWILEVEFKVDERNLIFKYIISSNQINKYIDTYIELDAYTNKAMPICEHQKIRVQYKDKLYINMSDQKLSLYFIYPEIKTWITCLSRIRRTVRESTIDKLFPKFNFNEVSMFLCFYSQDFGKKPIFEIITNIELFDLVRKGEFISLNLKLDCCMQGINYQWADRDEVISKFTVDAVLPLSSKCIFSRISTTQITSSLSMEIINNLRNFVEHPEISTSSLLFISNETVDKIKISGNNCKQQIILPHQCIPFGGTILVAHIDDKTFTINLSTLSYPLLLMKNCILSIASDTTSKNVHFSSVYILKNDLTTAVTLYSKKVMNKTKILTVQPISRGALPFLESTESSYLLGVGDNKPPKQQTFKLREGTSTYMMEGDVPISLKIYKDPITKSTIIHLRPGLSLVNKLPYPAYISIGNAPVSRGKQQLKPIEPDEERFDSMYQIESKVLLNVTIPKFEKCTGMAIVTTEHDGEKNKSKLQLGTYGFVTAVVERSQDAIKIVIKADLIIENRTLTKFHIISNNTSFSFRPGKFLFGLTDNLCLEYQGNVFPLAESFSRVSIDLSPEYKIFTFCRIEHHTRKHMYIQDIFQVKNEFDREIVFSSSNSCMKVKPGTTTIVNMKIEDNAVEIHCGNYKSAGLFFLGTEIASTVQLYNEEDDTRILFDIQVDDIHSTRIITIKPIAFPPKYAIINDTKYDVYAQQVEEIMPIKVDPFSSSAFGFDLPTLSSNVVLTIEGVLSTVCFTKTVFNVKFPLKVNGDILYLSVYTINSVTRALMITTTPMEPSTEVNIAIEVPKINISFIEKQKSIAALDINNIKFKISQNDSLQYKARFEIDNFQVDDHILNQVVLKKGGSFPFIDVEFQMSSYPFSISQITSIIIHKVIVEMNISDKMLLYFGSILEMMKLHEIDLKDYMAFFGKTILEPITVKAKFENIIPRFLGLYNDIAPRSTVTFWVPGLNLDHFSAPLSLLHKILHDTMQRSLVGRNKKYGFLLPQVACSRNKESNYDNFYYQNNDISVALFTGFPMSTSSIGYKLKYATEMKIKPPDSSQSSVQQNPDPIITLPRKLLSHVIRNPSNEEILLLGTENPKITQRRGLLKHSFILPSKVTVGVFEKLVVIRESEKESEYQLSKIKSMERNVFYINAFGKNKVPLFSITFDHENSAELFYLTLDSVLMQNEINYYF
ncbi:hypothetical protein TVAG_108950 [Trichomonas vaginalis G3]|uniref:Uncharacterized protein n=1 Tax=Trichomonas vaginalis (strain ATCC PRA-98 / G3) TaxID=412133 RepID=A2F036_TRIV3|nr:regulation of parkin-mediated stimulation of mitophagy in response to mitochondrial depolarization [Trichomonas vaginalis G3]EAY01738.1 hypothetical protein TVAG_108950 [Trichomonas vaginalis G3]KAI5532803.1 regulation of parkin-mediated stimulation of mitophagy in response to mitochondrial depolarization [Trichomonas vaginalis G3]|eukprot:XP_001314296.1 hypothetical protein [Trichomonas vaginalis G3]